jgi:hypothetical protein
VRNKKKKFCIFRTQFFYSFMISDIFFSTFGRSLVGGSGGSGSGGGNKGLL